MFSDISFYSIKYNISFKILKTIDKSYRLVVYYKRKVGKTLWIEKQK